MVKWAFILLDILPQRWLYKRLPNKWNIYKLQSSSWKDDWVTYMNTLGGTIYMLHVNTTLYYPRRLIRFSPSCGDSLIVSKFKYWFSKKKSLGLVFLLMYGHQRQPLNLMLIWQVWTLDCLSPNQFRPSINIFLKCKNKNKNNKFVNSFTGWTSLSWLRRAQANRCWELASI